jgi:hypothetical protein
LEMRVAEKRPERGHAATCSIGVCGL